MADPPPGNKTKRGSKRKPSTSTPRVRPPLITPASKIARVTQTQESTPDDINVFSPSSPRVAPAAGGFLSPDNPSPAKLPFRAVSEIVHSQSVSTQGDRVRTLKAKKAKKAEKTVELDKTTVFTFLCYDQLKKLKLKTRRYRAKLRARRRQEMQTNRLLNKEHSKAQIKHSFMLLQGEEPTAAFDYMLV